MHVIPIIKQYMQLSCTDWSVIASEIKSVITKSYDHEIGM